MRRVLILSLSSIGPFPSAGTHKLTRSRKHFPPVPGPEYDLDIPSELEAKNLGEISELIRSSAALREKRRSLLLISA